MIRLVHKALVLVVAASVVAVAGRVALASTPIPAKAEGTGNEATTGGGVMLGQPFAAKYADAVLDISFDQLQIYIFPKKVACSDVLYIPAPYIEVTVDTARKPIVVGHPSVANGIAYVQVDFHPAKSEKYYAIQPGASITFTRVDPSKNGVWHGKLSVKRQRDEGGVFSYGGTFAAHWCGKD
jgi:hypothetical protein